MPTLFGKDPDDYEYLGESKDDLDYAAWYVNSADLRAEASYALNNMGVERQYDLFNFLDAHDRLITLGIMTEDEFLDYLNKYGVI